MQVSIPPKVRVVLYVATALGTPVIAYLLAKDYIGSLEVALWSGEVAVINVLAALNVQKNDGASN
ncbi:hypothetical protein [Naasia lichenicola]|uniref:Holin n=1 Tax=Naasia lichenicola TaxID=2565933 RepID=A0A4S4FNS0_9MICO|nr:hypothetical protein [Naasia lichenicola]THG30667.1 hypothetical protein E6C64_08485 [Naasia lichenicola]THG31904.1 hypothetical protein E6C64_07630 [Naasia lichenicola]